MAYQAEKLCVPMGMDPGRYIRLLFAAMDIRCVGMGTRRDLLIIRLQIVSGISNPLSASFTMGIG